MKYLLLICLTSLTLGLNADDKLNLEQILHDDSNKFTATMSNEVAKENVGKSFVQSAFSVMPLLGQVALASVGESHDEILNSLGIPNDDVIKAIFSYTNSLVQSVKNVTLRTANKIYVEQGGELNKTFTAVSKDVFGSEVENVDFQKSVDVANKINQWVEKQTNHVIKDLVTSDDLRKVSVVLVNAIYFKGSWKTPFDESYTIDTDFHVSKSKVTKVKMMHQDVLLNYVESEELNAQVLELPYQGNAFSLVVVLPRDIEGINELEEKLKDLSALDKARNGFSEIKVDVGLPRFKIETKTNLKTILERVSGKGKGQIFIADSYQMNVNKIFNEKLARIENLLIGAKLSIGSATQKAFIEVNEEGTEAGAANDLTGVKSLGIRFHADHPFAFYLYHGRNILFNGVYYA